MHISLSLYIYIYVYTYIYIYIYIHTCVHTEGGQQFGVLALKGEAKPHPPRILSSVLFSWHLAEEISELLLTSVICLKRPPPIASWGIYIPPNLEIDSVRENISSMAWVIYSAIPAMLKSSSHNLCLRLAPCATTLFAHLRTTPKRLSS